MHKSPHTFGMTVLRKTDTNYLSFMEKFCINFNNRVNDVFIDIHFYLTINTKLMEICISETQVQKTK